MNPGQSYHITIFTLEGSKHELEYDAPWEPVDEVISNWIRSSVAVELVDGTGVVLPGHQIKEVQYKLNDG